MAEQPTINLKDLTIVQTEAGQLRLTLKPGVDPQNPTVGSQLVLTEEQSPPVGEAPQDGKQYARKDKAWSEVMPGVVDRSFDTSVTLEAGSGFTAEEILNGNFKGYVSSLSSPAMPVIDGKNGYYDHSSTLAANGTDRTAVQTFYPIFEAGKISPAWTRYYTTADGWSGWAEMVEVGVIESLQTRNTYDERCIQYWDVTELRWLRKNSQREDYTGLRRMTQLDVGGGVNILVPADGETRTQFNSLDNAGIDATDNPDFGAYKFSIFIIYHYDETVTATSTAQCLGSSSTQAGGVTVYADGVVNAWFRTQSSSTVNTASSSHDHNLTPGLGWMVVSVSASLSASFPLSVLSVSDISGNIAIFQQPTTWTVYTTVSSGRIENNEAVKFLHYAKFNGTIPTAECTAMFEQWKAYHGIVIP